MKELRKTTCNRDCPDACSIVATVEDGRVTRLQGDPDHPVTRGFLCYRTSHLLESDYYKDRLTTPLMRVNGEFTPVGWDGGPALAAENVQGSPGGASARRFSTSERARTTTSTTCSIRRTSFSGERTSSRRARTRSPCFGRP